MKKAEKVVQEDEESTEVAVQYEISDPVIGEDGQIQIRTNYSELQQYLERKIGHYKKLKLTEKNIPLIEFAKKEVQTVRTTLEKKCKEYKDTKLQVPIDFLNAEKKAALGEISDVEKHLDELLEQYDQTRIDDLNASYEQYRVQACEKYGVEKAEVKMAYDKSFYLKGAGKNQEVLRQKIFDYVRDYKAAKDKKANDISLVKMTCGEKLDAEPYISQLEFRDISEILIQIQGAKDRQEAAAQEVLDENTTDSVEEDEAPINVGVDGIGGTRNNESPKAVEMVTKTVELTYPKNKGEKLTGLFKSLKAEGITYKFV